MFNFVGLKKKKRNLNCAEVLKKKGSKNTKSTAAAAITARIKRQDAKSKKKKLLRLKANPFINGVYSDFKNGSTSSAGFFVCY